MILFSITLGRLFEDLLKKEGTVSYHDVQICRYNEEYLEVHNLTECGITVCIPSGKQKAGSIYEIGSKSSNIIQYNLFSVPQDVTVCILDGCTHNEAAPSNICFQVHDIRLNETNAALDFYRILTAEDGFRVEPADIGIGPLVYWSIVSESGIAASDICKIRPVKQGLSQFYGADLTGYSLYNEMVVQTVELIFELDYAGKERRNMGILSTLLSGGLLVGKLCQAVSSAVNRTGYRDAESGVLYNDSGLVYNGVNVSLKTKDNHTEVMAYNQDTDLKKTIQFPVNSNGTSMSYTMNAFSSQDIGADIVKCENPDDTIEITTPSDEKSNGPVILKLRIKDIIVGDSTSMNDIGRFTVRVGADGLKISGGSMIAMDYFSFQTKSGVALSSYDQIPAQTEADTVIFPIEFSQYAVTTGDVISGQVSISLASGNNDMFVSKSKPLEPSDIRFLKHIGAIKDENNC